MCQKDGQIRTLTGERWDVASESKDGEWYRASFARDGPTCKCAYHIRGRGRRCKHISTVEQQRPISSEPTPASTQSSTSSSPTRGWATGPPPRPLA